MAEISKAVEKKALEYVRSRLEKGASEYDIKKELLASNYPAGLANRLLRKAGKKGLKISYILIGILIIIASYFLITYLTENRCDSLQCFVTAADECESASFQSVQAGSLFEYRTRNCILTTRVIKVNDTEPIEIRELLEGKSMRCKYEKGKFNTELIETISVGIENCTGELKDSIELLVAV